MGKRVIFITDAKEHFFISFEEGMAMMDMLPQTQRDVPGVSFQCCKVGKYIHLRRANEGRVSFAFFHMELQDNNCTTVYLPGQMVVSPGYKWTDSIEPVLLELLKNLSANTTEA